MGYDREQKGKKFQVCTAEKQKARPPCCFLLKVGMRKVLSSEEVFQKIMMMIIIDMFNTQLFVSKTPTACHQGREENGGINIVSYENLQ